MKNLLATPQSRTVARRRARANSRSAMVAQADAQLVTLRRTIAEIKTIQAETAELQTQTAANLRETSKILRGA